jgi:CRISPR-associated endonuclease/helicase Cas3
MNEEPTNREFIAHYREIDKQPQGLWEHLEETALLSANNADKIGLAKQGELIGLVHDLGKATAQFDQYIRSATGLIDPDEEGYLSAEDLKGKIDHSSAGAQLIFNYLNQQGPQSILASQFLTLVITSHHSGLIDCITPDGIDKYSARMAKAQELTRIVEAEANLPPRIRKRLYSLLDDAQLVPGLIATIKNLRDDNDSQETLFFKMGLLVRFLFSCLIDADRTNTAEFENPYEKSLKMMANHHLGKILAVRLEQYLGH